MWIVAPEVVQQYGDLKKPETAIGTGPFLLEHYEPHVKAVFQRNPDHFRTDQPWVDGVAWLVVDDAATRLAMYRTGQLDLMEVRQQDLEALKQSHPQLGYQDYLSNVPELLSMRTDQPPFTDVRVRRAISMAIDRQALIEAVWVRGQPIPAIACGLTEWSLPIDQLGAGAQYYQYNAQAAKRLLADAGFPTGFKTQLHATVGYGPDLLDVVQLIQRFLRDVGIEVELKLQEYGAYMATTTVGKFEGMTYGVLTPAWEPHSPLTTLYRPDQPRNRGHVNDPTLTAMPKAQRQTMDLEVRKQLIFDIQQYAAEQQYYVYTNSVMLTGSWQPYVKHYAPNPTFDFGGRAAALWLDR
jgi:peptide/nickel transport system substrate-binding protein